MFRFHTVVVITILPILHSLLILPVRSQNEHISLKETYDAALFEPSDRLRDVSFPSHFPKPTRMIDDAAVPIMEPTFGVHRSHVDAVLAYAEGYTLAYYMMFIETLKDTGFTGDVVLAIADSSIIKPNVEDYLRTYARNDPAASTTTMDDQRLHVVVYQAALVCAESNGTTTRHLTPRGETDVFEMCQLDHVYGWKDVDGNIISTTKDPRSGRVVATLRYEFYWIWSLRYGPSNWLMLLDARDSYFQSNPFANLPRQQQNQDPSTIVNGLLYLFGENAEATRLGRSTKNLKWIRNGYGEFVLDALRDKPTICSGSTMGEQIAIETYLRALVNEHDECHVRMAGSDQGFHNYLYYSGKLEQADTIRRIIVWEQGRGIINNLGALRTKTLEEWGIYDVNTNVVHQWDGVTVSPVVHQWDRDNHLHKHMVTKRHKEWVKQWEESKGVVIAHQ